jgi:hypothetical protein
MSQVEGLLWNKWVAVQPSYLTTHILHLQPEEYDMQEQRIAIRFLQLSRLLCRNEIPTTVLLELAEGKRFVDIETHDEENYRVYFPLNPVQQMMQDEADYLQARADAQNESLQTGIILKSEREELEEQIADLEQAIEIGGYGSNDLRILDSLKKELEDLE